MDDEKFANTMNGYKSAIAIPISQLKGFPKTQIPKTLTEHKTKRLHILTFINEHKHILFTKKAFKHEKEKIWRQIFTKMLEFGMVSKEKDWRYVRDVSFSNWRKRAQKRLKHLAANGYRLNMDECEFLIYDILGKTPDKMVAEEEQGNFAENWMGNNDSEAMEEEDSDEDEYMIDSDENEDEDDVSFDERLFVPKIVFNENIQTEREEMDHESQGSGTMHVNHRQSQAKSQQQHQSIQEKADSHDLILKQELNKPIVNKTNGTHLNGNGQRHTYSAKNTFSSAQGNSNVGEQMSNNRSQIKCPIPLNDTTFCNFETGSDQDGELSSSSPSRYMNKFRELRLLDLEIENKVLKNRYMKLKIYQLEQILSLEHCKEVKELGNSKVSSPSSKSIGPFKSNEQSNGEQQQQQQQQLNLPHKQNNTAAKSNCKTRN